MEKVTLFKLKTSLCRNLVYNLQTLRGFCRMQFLQFCCKFSMKIIFYLPVNNDKPKFVTFLLLFCLYNCFIYWTNFVFWKCLESICHLGSGHKTVNSQGYSKLLFSLAQKSGFQTIYTIQITITYIENITWPRGDTKFLFECWKIFHSFATLTRKIFFQHEKRNFVSPSGHVMFYLLYKHQWNTKPFHFNSFLVWKARFIM